MYSKILTQLPLTLVTLAEAKAQCRRTDFDLDDALISAFILVASELAQSYTRRMLRVGTAVTLVEQYYRQVQLPYGEVTEVTEVLLDGQISNDFTFDEISQKVTFSKSYSEAKITYNAGYVSVPSVVKQAVLLTVSTLYNNRDNYVVGLSVAKLPTTAEMLLESVRYYAV